MKDKLLNTIVGVWEAAAVNMQHSSAKLKGEALQVALAKADVLWYCAGQIRQQLNIKDALVASSRRVARRRINQQQT